MKNIKLIINNIILKDDTDEQNEKNVLTELEIEEKLDDIISSLKATFTPEIKDYINLQNSQIVELYEENKRIFYGKIINIKDDLKEVSIECLMETEALLRKRVNKIYTETESHQGKNELIVKDLIEKAGLTAQVTSTNPPNIVSEFKCIQATIFERILTLLKAVDYQLRYDPEERKVYYEPRGFKNNNKTITTDDLFGIPEVEETTDGMINVLRIDGATTETQITESGTIGTTQGFTTSYIQLTKTPNIVELIINGVQRKGGSKDASTDHYYWVDRENKRIMPKQGTSFPNGATAVVNYSWSAPAPVQDFRQDSIDKYGRFEEVMTFNDISSVADAEARIEKLLDARSKPFKIIKIKTEAKDISTGELVRLNDELTGLNEKFVVTQINRKYPNAFDEVVLGDKEWRLEDDIVEIENRVKRLEERFIRNQDLVLQLVRIQDDFTEKIRERYTAIYEKNIGGDILIWGNQAFGIWGQFKWGNEANQSFILGKGRLGLNALGSKTSEEVLKFMSNYGDYLELFIDDDFKDTATATWNTTNKKLTF